MILCSALLKKLGAQKKPGREKGLLLHAKTREIASGLAEFEAAMRAEDRVLSTPERNRFSDIIASAAQLVALEARLEQQGLNEEAATQLAPLKQLAQRKKTALNAAEKQSVLAQVQKAEKALCRDLLSDEKRAAAKELVSLAAEVTGSAAAPSMKAMRKLQGALQNAEALLTTQTEQDWRDSGICIEVGFDLHFARKFLYCLTRFERVKMACSF